MNALKKALNTGYAWGMYQHLDEITSFGNLLLKHRTRRILEIGAHRGGSTAFFAVLCPDLVVSVDLPSGKWGGIGATGAGLRNTELGNLYPHCRAVLGDSHSMEVLQAVKATMNGVLFDALFIDGDHSYAGVRQDFQTYASLVKPEGLIGFHDILHCKRHTDDGVEVPQFWDELKASTGMAHEEFVSNNGWGGIGVLYV